MPRQQATKLHPSFPKLLRPLPQFDVGPRHGQHRCSVPLQGRLQQLCHRKDQNIHDHLFFPIPSLILGDHICNRQTGILQHKRRRVLAFLDRLRVLES